MANRKIGVPWWSKIGAKLVLSRIPLGYRVYSRIGVFRHGKMHQPDYAIDIFLRHFGRTPFRDSGQPFVGLEIGVGDSVASAIIAHTFGADRYYLVDSGRFAAEDIDTYSAIIARMRERGHDTGELEGATSVGQLLETCNAVYLTEGLRSLKQIPSASVDFIWSNAVLEHVRKHEFDEMQRELFRVCRPGAFLSHRVDLKDHLGGKLNNRRLPSRLWEAEWMAKSGFYTNRIGYSEMLARFGNAGFAVDVLQVDKWPEPPTRRDRMAREFADLDDDDLLVSGFDVLLRRQDSGPGQTDEQ